jgi:hypothetical protein
VPALRVSQDVVQQHRFARAETATKNGENDRL